MVLFSRLWLPLCTSMLVRVCTDELEALTPSNNETCLPCGAIFLEVEVRQLECGLSYSESSTWLFNEARYILT